MQGDERSIRETLEAQASALTRLREISRGEALTVMARSFERDRRDSEGTDAEGTFRLYLRLVDQMRLRLDG